MENPATAGFWLSPQQRHIWALQQKGYANRGRCLVLIEGAVSADDMELCLRRLVARHEILRTVYRHQAGMKFLTASIPWYGNRYRRFSNAKTFPATCISATVPRFRMR